MGVARLAHMFDIDADASEAELRDVVERCERLKATAAAAQARATALWASRRRAAEAAAGVPARKRGRGLASEVALARRDAPVNGNQHLGFANALVHEMPHTLAALEAGVLTEWRATLIVKQSACLTVEDRRALDAEMCADPQALVGLGNARVEAKAAEIAARLDAAAVVERKNRAAQSAGVWTRCAPNGMVYLTALMPLSQGIGVYATLKREADVCADGRARGQVMTETLHERVTARSADQPAPVAVNLVMADTTLFGEDDCPGWVAGYGPVPAVVARDLVSDALDSEAKATLRRLYRHPSQRATGRDGIAGADLPQRVGPLHRVAGSDLPNPLLQRPDPPHRPHHPCPAGRQNHCAQRDGILRSLQLRQRSPRLDRHHQRNPRGARRRVLHPHRRGLPLHRTPTTRTAAQIQRARGPAQHRRGRAETDCLSGQPAGPVSWPASIRYRNRCRKHYVVRADELAGRPRTIYRPDGGHGRGWFEESPDFTEQGDC